ncbi:ABC-2 type transport system permease protein [Blastococcus mobilis]|uniref:ABC-2 type transport system permease protein n=1 Tax=Blastococcus mobilis TaxID=1938746 RepID=A0A238YRT8_9ACTN|nr:ABC-2 type transport system permease protein [Blastococcus mobilis]
MGLGSPIPAPGSVRQVLASATPSRNSFARAVADLRGGWAQRQLWAHLGWQDIRQRYRRSVLGPIWITISMAVTAVALGVLYAGLFGNDLSVQLPYILVGFIIWAFISGCISEGSEVFIANEGLIRQLPAPLSVHVYRLVWRQMLFFAHNLIVYVVMLVIFPQQLGWDSLTVFPALLLLGINGAWVALLLGIVTTRFRDLAPITQSVVQLLFFLTPIVWIYDDLLKNAAVAERARLVEFNPLLHFIEIVRQPMLGQEQHLRHWVVVLLITVVGWALTLVALRRYRSRVAYWV